MTALRRGLMADSGGTVAGPRVVCIGISPSRTSVTGSAKQALPDWSGCPGSTSGRSAAQTTLLISENAWPAVTSGTAIGSLPAKRTCPGPAGGLGSSVRNQ